MPLHFSARFYFEEMMQGWGKILEASKYMGIAPRTLRPLLKKGLKHSRLSSGTILIKFSDIDEFLKSFQVNENQVEKIVGETMKELVGGK